MGRSYLFPKSLPQRLQVTVQGPVVPEDKARQESEDRVADPPRLRHADACARPSGIGCELVRPGSAERRARARVDLGDEPAWRPGLQDDERQIEPAHLLTPDL